MIKKTDITDLRMLTITKVRRRFDIPNKRIHTCLRLLYNVYSMKSINYVGPRLCWVHTKHVGGIHNQWNQLDMTSFVALMHNILISPSCDMMQPACSDVVQ